MIIHQNCSLQPYNTFHIDVTANYLCTVKSVAALQALLKDEQWSKMPILILGGGSNVLLTKNFEGLVILNELKGISLVSETEEYVLVKAAAGEVWHNLVLWAIAHNYGGIENLSLIPGSVGAGPMQNIGAYGVELKNSFYELEALNKSTSEIEIFNGAACKFGYRQSVFKSELKDKYIITSVTFKLNKNPTFNTSYGAINQELEKMGITELNLRNISNAVINIRKSKLPDPNEIGNAGSFFKNPEVAATHYETLKLTYPDCVGYALPNGKVKLAAGWLIEQCGWKGKKVGNTGSHKNQSLVLVNYGNASGNEVYQLAKAIQQSVAEKFNVHLEMEVNII